MIFDLAEGISKAVLYEGYMLYPYRPSAIKNQQRWTFGTLYPQNCKEVQEGGERSVLHAECLLRSKPDAGVQVRVRFLQFENPGADPVERMLEYVVRARKTNEREQFSFPTAQGEIRASLSFQCEKIPEEAVAAELFRISIDLSNDSDCDPSAEHDHTLSHSLLSAHVMFAVEEGEFISLLDPPPELQERIAECRNVGCFPVLVGDEIRRNLILCSPIILYDFPKVAPESVGDFFDATEIDEMLTLRVMTLTEEEKQEIQSAGGGLSELLRRTEQTAREQLARTHGVIRGLRSADEP